MKNNNLNSRVFNLKKRIELFSKRSKILFVVDENVKTLIPYIERLGYTRVTTFDPGTKDLSINEKLNKLAVLNRPTILITNDSDFYRFPDKKYFILRVKNTCDKSKETKEGFMGLLKVWIKTHLSELSRNQYSSYDLYNPGSKLW